MDMTTDGWNMSGTNGVDGTALRGIPQVSELSRKHLEHLLGLLVYNGILHHKWLSANGFVLHTEVLQTALLFTGCTRRGGSQPSVVSSS